MWEDLRPLGRDVILQHFPHIYKQCKDEGYDVLVEPIPVVPAQHYHMGGVKAGDKNAAINMDVMDDSKVLLGVNTTSPMKGLNVILYAGDNEVFRTTADVAPDKPYVKIINIDKNID